MPRISVKSIPAVLAQVVGKTLALEYRRQKQAAESVWVVSQEAEDLAPCSVLVIGR